MSPEVEIRTATMAKIYVEQGYLEKAAAIYRHLLTQNPDRQDFLDALDRIEKKLSSKKKIEPSHMVALFREWIDLLLRYNQYQKLKKIQHHYNR